MKSLERRSKAYFISARLLQYCASVKDIFELAAQELDVSQEDMEEIRQTIDLVVVPALRNMGIHTKSYMEVRDE